MSSSTFTGAAETPLSEGGLFTSPVNAGTTDAVRRNGTGRAADTAGGKYYSAALCTAADANGTDQWSEVVGGSGTEYGPACRITSATNASCYFALASGTTVYLYRFIDTGTAFTPTLLGAAFTGVTAGSTIRLQAQGSTLTVFANGVSLGTRTDGTLTTGRLGFLLNNASIDSWQGENLVAAVTATHAATFGVQQAAASASVQVTATHAVTFGALATRTASHEWVFAASLADWSIVFATAGITVTWLGTDGDPPGCVKYAASDPGAGGTTKLQSPTVTWEGLGVPPGAPVTGVRPRYKRRLVARSGSVVATVAMQIQAIPSGFPVTFGTSNYAFLDALVDYTPQLAWEAIGPAPLSTVYPAYQASNTSIVVKIWCWPTGAGSLELRLDEIVLDIDYLAPATVGEARVVITASHAATFEAQISTEAGSEIIQITENATVEEQSSSATAAVIVTASQYATFGPQVGTAAAVAFAGELAGNLIGSMEEFEGVFGSLTEIDGVLGSIAEPEGAWLGSLTEVW